MILQLPFCYDLTTCKVVCVLLLFPNKYKCFHLLFVGCILYELGYGVDVEEDVVYCTTSHTERKSI